MNAVEWMDCMIFAAGAIKREMWDGKKERAAVAVRKRQSLGPHAWSKRGLRCGKTKINAIRI